MTQRVTVITEGRTELRSFHCLMLIYNYDLHGKI